MRLKILFLSILFVVITFTHAQILPTFGNSRTGGSGMQFLKIAPDARSAAMGGAVVGLVNDASAMYWNPAGITSIDTGKVTTQFSHTRWFGNSQVNYGAVAFKAGKLSYVGVNVLSLGFNETKETTEFEPNGTGRNVLMGSTSIGVTFAKILTNNFSFGIQTKFAQEVIANVTVNNVLFDLGLTYNIGIKNSRFGVTFTNFGVNVAPSGNVTILNLNGEIQKNEFTSISAPAIFRLGFAIDPISNKTHVLTTAAQLNHPTDNNETVGLGLEYSWKKILIARSGWEFGLDEANNFPSLGFGVKLPTNFGNFGIDYGIVSKSRIGNIHRIGLLFTIK
jgi:hypothetical protein